MLNYVLPVGSFLILIHSCLSGHPLIIYKVSIQEEVSLLKCPLNNHTTCITNSISAFQERAIITEFTYNNNKRSDLNTTVQKHSFRSFNGNNYKISITKANEKSCHHMDEIDSYMFLNNLRKAWKQNEAGNLVS